MGAPLRLVFNPTGGLDEAARDCEADVFRHWYGNTREQLVDEYAPYERDSVFLAVADEHDDVLACGRFLTGATAELKTIVDVQRPPWTVDAPRAAAAVGVDLTRTWDLATMGVRRGIRQGATRLASALYHGFTTAVRVNRVGAMIAILDEHVHRVVASAGVHLQALPGTRPEPYLGSPASRPVYARTAPYLDYQRRHRPEAHRLLTLGVGLDGVQVPERAHFRLDPFPLAPSVPSRVTIPAPARELVSVGTRSQG